MKYYKVLLFLSYFLFIALPAISSDSDKNGELGKAMAQHLSCYPLELLDFKKQEPIIKTRDVCLATIYHETGASPLWVTDRGPVKKAFILVDYLRSAYREGIDPEEYEISKIEKLLHSMQVEDLAQLDTLLTYNLVKYVHDMSFGQIKYRELDPDLFSEAGDENFNPAAAVKAALAAPDFSAYLEALPPRHKYYTGLRNALAYFQEVGRQEQWEPIPPGSLIRPGQQDERLEAVQRRIALTSRTEPRDQPVEMYDDDLVAEVKSFQATHGLKPDGIIGPQTLSWLNKSPDDLADIIRVNMARWRWQDHELGDTHIIVNIAGFYLSAIRAGQVALEMPVIVGKLQHKTPVFSDKIRYLDFNPFWNVPPTIARNEELPELRKDPAHLVNRHIRVFSSWQSDAIELDSMAIDWKAVSRKQMGQYKLRQDPGPWNALGRVKFVFPNTHSVYLHDTPTQNLFNQHRRTFSHGCIRVSEPLKLAFFCLEDQGGKWSEADMKKVMEDGERMVVSLKGGLPIHITYQTAYPDESGTIRFSEDIYNRDTKLKKALEETNPARKS